MMSLIEQVCPRLKCLCIFSDYPVPEKAMMLIGSLLRPVFHSLLVLSGRVLGCSRADGTADKDMDSLLKLLKWDESGDDESQEGVTGAEEKKLEESEEESGEVVSCEVVSCEEVSCEELARVTREGSVEYTRYN